MSHRERHPSLKDRLPAHAYRAYRRMRFFAVYEALMRAFWPFVTLLVLFLALSLWGLWMALPLPLHAAGLAAFAGLALYFFWRGIRLVRFPSRAELLARLEARSALKDAQLHTLADYLPEGASQEEMSLWRVWQGRLKSRVGPVKTGWPSINLAPRDPYALRFIPALLLAAGLVLYSTEAGPRLGSAFTFTLPPAQPVDVTAWAEPPEYTGLPVVYLGGSEEEVRLPAGSRLRVQVNGAGETRLALREGDVESYVEPQVVESGAAQNYDVTLEETTGAIRLMQGLDAIAEWPLDVVPDTPPVISLSREPEFAYSGSLQLSYEMHDDYGVVSAEAVFEADEDMAPHALVPPPRLSLVVPGAGAGSGRSYKDVSSSPWTGEALSMRLAATDGAGQTGMSDPVGITLPARQFSNPFAAEVVRLRRVIALDRREEREALGEMMQLLNAMAGNEVDVTAFTGLAQAFWRLRYAREDETRRSALDLMWQVALDLEGDAGALAAQALRQAQEELREALRNDASPEEIAEKIANLQRAIAEFLASQPMMQMDPSQMQAMPQMEMRDISQMLEDMQSLAESGAREQAEALLNNLEAMLENLQMMQAMQQMQSPMMQGLQQLQELMRSQQQLRDQTYQQEQGESMSAEQMQQALEELARQQGELAEMLRQMMEEMQMDPGQGQQQGEGGENGQTQQPGEGQGEGGGMSPAQSLAEALRQMMQSQGQLGQGDASGSGQSQNDALQALRQAGQQMLNMMAQQQPGQGPQGTGYMPGQAPSANRDPLGREADGFRQDGVEVPTETEAERVRELLYQLRERLSDPALDVIDENYIERLLRY